MAEVPFDFPDWAPLGSYPLPRRIRRGTPRRAVAVESAFPVGKFVLFLTSVLALLCTTLLSGPRGLPFDIPDTSPTAVLERQLKAVQDVDTERVLRLAAGRLFHEQGRYKGAATHFEAARMLANADGGKVGDFVTALCGLGGAQLQQGLSEAAQRSFLDAEKALKDLSPDLATAENFTQVLTGNEDELAFQVFRGLGDVQRELGHVEAALEYYKQALASSSFMRDQAVAESDIGESHGQLGHLEVAAEHLLRALRLHDLALRGTRSSLGGRVLSQELAVAVTTTSLAGVRHSQGDIHKAAELYVDALQVQQRPGGLAPGHPDLVAARLGQARARRDLGDLHGALRAIAGVERGVSIGPAEGLVLSRVLVLKADLLREAGELRGAERVAREALRQQQERLDLERPEVATARLVLGGILHDLGQLTRAEEEYQSALAISERTLGPQHPETAAVHNALGTLHADRSDHTAAEVAFSRCLKIQVAAVGPTGPGVSNTYNNLATVLFRNGNPDKASRLLEDALAALDKAGVPRGNPERAIYEDNLAAIRSNSTEARGEGVSAV